MGGQQHLTVTSTTVLYAWFTSWLPATAMEKAKLALKSKAVTGNFQAQPAIQLAPIRADNPGAASTKGTLTVGAGEACTGVLDLSEDVDDQFR